MRNLRSVLLVGAVLFGVSAHADDRGPPPEGEQGQGQGGPQRGPPQAAIEACASRSSGEACSFSDRGHDLTGTCWSPSSDKPLACKPAQGPR
jgi:hypothetical protein